MKKFLILIGALALTLTLRGCSNDVEELPEIPETVTMDTVDDFLGRPDVQYVDLRNFDDKMKSGYISGFEMIPFFDYLEATDILVRTDEWNFSAADIHSQGGLEELFDADRTIFLMCGSGTRAGYVKVALESLGFENVINIGGIADYSGEAMVTGDGSYNIEVQLSLPTVVDMDNIDMYLGRTDVQYVDLRNFDDKMKSGYIAGFEFLPFFDYMEFSDVLVRTDGDWVFAAEDIVSESGLRGLFNADKAIFLMCGSGTRAGYVKAALESLGYTHVYNIGGIGNYAGDYNVLGDGVFGNVSTIRGTYTPGVHYGDNGAGYMAVIVINANGGIENVTFDAISCTEIKVDDGTGTMISQDPKEYSSCTTKQTLGFDYGMVAYSGGAVTLEWFEQANLLAAAIVANQGWVTGWELVVGTSHTNFDATDAEVIADGIAGVSIGIEGFQAALLDALTNATPAS